MKRRRKKVMRMLIGKFHLFEILRREDCGNQGIRESGNQRVRESESQGIRESESQRVRELETLGLSEGAGLDFEIRNVLPANPWREIHP